MKKLLVVFVSLFIAALSVTSYGAKGNVEINLSCENVQNNRIFDVSVFEVSDTQLCAGEMVVSYDNSLVEFRNVESDGYEVGFIDSSDKVHIVFAKDDEHAPENGKIIDIEFKSIDYGSFDLGVTCNECIDSNLDTFSVNSESAEVEITKKGVNVSTKKSSKNKSVSSSRSQVESSDESDVTDFAPATIDVAKNEKPENIVLPVILGVVLLVVVFYLGIIFSKKYKLDEADEKEQDESDDYNEFWM